MQTIINKSGPYLTVIVLAVIMVAFFQPTSANACGCKRKPNFGCCGNGPCNIVCCNCDRGCNKQCEATTCNTLEWLECAGVVTGCVAACLEPPPACLLCMGPAYTACAKCYSGGVECVIDSTGKDSCPLPLQCINGKCNVRSDESEFLSFIPDDLNQIEGEVCQDDSSVSRDNFFESIANFDGESFTISRREMRRFIRLEKKRTGMVLNAPFSEMFDAFDTDDNQLIDRFEFDNEDDYSLIEPDDNQLIDRGEFDNEEVDY
jgi:hypothetical protein